MEFSPALTLWVLSAIRIPTAFDARRGSVFRATILAAIACTLYIPGIYYGTDPLLGGRNRVGLIMLVLLLLGFWQFRTAILLAVVADERRRRHQLAGGVVVVSFLTSHVESTDRNLSLTYGDQPGMEVFLRAGSAFIIWVCCDIARVCWRNIPGMQSPAFKTGFVLIGIGCLAFCLVLLDRLLYGAVTIREGPGSQDAGTLNAILESTSGRVLNTLRPHPETRLHRQLFEICQMAGGKATMAPTWRIRPLQSWQIPTTTVLRRISRICHSWSCQCGHFISVPRDGAQYFFA